MGTTEQRREVYRYYRSIGYSASEARKMRNRGRARIAKEYIKKQKAYTRKRIKSYEKREPHKTPKPYRPKFEIRKKEKGNYKRILDRYHVSQDIQNEILSSGYLDTELYIKRINKLKPCMKNKRYSWTELMDKLERMQDLGDWLDALGEVYDEKG